MYLFKPATYSYKTDFELFYGTFFSCKLRQKVAGGPHNKAHYVYFKLVNQYSLSRLPTLRHGKLLKKTGKFHMSNTQFFPLQT